MPLKPQSAIRHPCRCSRRERGILQTPTRGRPQAMHSAEHRGRLALAVAAAEKGLDQRERAPLRGGLVPEPVCVGLRAQPRVLALG